MTSNPIHICSQQVTISSHEITPINFACPQRKLVEPLKGQVQILVKPGASSRLKTLLYHVSVLGMHRIHNDPDHQRVGS